MTCDDWHVRAANEDDLPRILEIHRVAFPDGRSEAARRRQFTANPMGSLSELLVVEREVDPSHARVGTPARDREVVAHAFLFRSQSWFGGERVNVGAIASVATSPEMRGQGVAAHLLRFAHEKACVRGDAVTMLYAFRQGFYARMGYGPTSARKRLAVAPEAIAASWRALASKHVRAARGEDRPFIEQAYARAGEAKSGWLTRDATAWEREFCREDMHWLVADGGLSGYVAFEIGQAEPHAQTRIRVVELVASDCTTRRALWGALGAMRDQVSVIDVETSLHDAIDFALLDADAGRFGTRDVEHTLGCVVGGPMVRMASLARAIEARGYRQDGAMLITLETSREDEASEAGGAAAANAGAHQWVYDAIEGSFLVEVTGGRARVRQATEAERARSDLAVPHLRANRSVLSSVFYGGLAPSEAVALGLARGDFLDAGDLDALVALGRFDVMQPF